MKNQNPRENKAPEMYTPAVRMAWLDCGRQRKRGSMMFPFLGREAIYGGGGLLDADGDGVGWDGCDSRGAASSWAAAASAGEDDGDGGLESEVYARGSGMQSGLAGWLGGWLAG